MDYIIHPPLYGVEEALREWSPEWIDFSLGHNLMRMPKRIDSWDTGITHRGQAQKKWQSFSMETKNECLWMINVYTY